MAAVLVCPWCREPMQRFLCKENYAKVPLHMAEDKAPLMAPATPADRSDAADVVHVPTNPPPLGAEAIKAFAHPLRTAMYQYLSAHGSATASQLARQFVENTGATSYHLRQLEKHGLIEDDPDR